MQVSIQSTVFTSLRRSAIEFSEIFPKKLIVRTNCDSCTVPLLVGIDENETCLIQIPYVYPITGKTSNTLCEQNGTKAITEIQSYHNAMGQIITLRTANTQQMNTQRMLGNGLYLYFSFIQARVLKLYQYTCHGI